MKNIFIQLIAFLLITSMQGQQFVEKADIEFEVNTNLKKQMNGNSWQEMMKENISDLKTSFYKYSFENNKSIYKFDRWSTKTRIPKYQKDSDEENVWYYDFTSNKMNIQKQIEGTTFITLDSINKIEWKITNENREIAGYNCRKAVGKIFDEVYVFAFYTDALLISGGPCSINGLPGMILGVTIPQLYTSFVATKVTITATNANEIKPLLSKKPFTYLEMKKFIIDKSNDWFNYGTDDEEKKKQKKMFLIESML